MSELNLTPAQLQILRHMLGIDRADVKDPKPYRNYYCANQGNTAMQELAVLGAVRLYRKSDSYDWYTTTDAGRAAAIESQRAIRAPKRKRLYARYLDAADAIPDLSFHDFLTRPDFADARAGA